jgi:hypothetical protein
LLLAQPTQWQSALVGQAVKIGTLVGTLFCQFLRLLVEAVVVLFQTSTGKTVVLVVVPLGVMLRRTQLVEPGQQGKVVTVALGLVLQRIIVLLAVAVSPLLGKMHKTHLAVTVVLGL